MTTTLMLVLVLYYAVVLIIGVFKFRDQSKSEYVTAPNSTGFVVLTLSLLSTIVGGGMFLGVAQIGYGGGMTAIALGVAYLIGSAMIGLLAPRLREACRRRNVSTLFGLFESIYPSNRNISAATLFVWTTFAVFLLMLAVQFLSIATFLKFYASINFHVAILVGAGIVASISTIFYSAFGGFRRDLWTDVVQMVFIATGVAMILVAEAIDSSFRSSLAALPPEFFTVGGDGVLFFIGALFFVAPTFLIRFDLWQRVVTAKTSVIAKYSFITSGIVAFLFFVFFGLLGMYGKALDLKDGQFIALEVIQRNMSGLGHSLAVAAFFAAVMSTADTFLGVTSLALAKGTIRRRTMGLDTTDDPSFVHETRKIAVIVGFISLVVAYMMQDIVDAFATAFGLLAVFLPALIGGLVRADAKERDARFSIISGLLVVIAVVPFAPKAAYLPGVVVATCVYLIMRNISGKRARPLDKVGVVRD